MNLSFTLSVWPGVLVTHSFIHSFPRYLILVSGIVQSVNVIIGDK
jgi:hypothetical protein